MRTTFQVRVNKLVHRSGSNEFSRVQTEITLIRHGETEFNLAGRIQGTRDSALTDEGRTQAKELGAVMKKHLFRPAVWFVSPQGRARETSRILREAIGLDDLPPEVPDDLLCEVNCGDFEGRLHSEVDQDVLWQIRNHADAPYPGGESLLDVMDRARRFFEGALSERPESGMHRMLVVSHGNWIRAAGAVLLDAGPGFALRALCHNTAIHRFVARDRNDRFRLVTWNERSHLTAGNAFDIV